MRRDCSSNLGHKSRYRLGFGQNCAIQVNGRSGRPVPLFIKYHAGVCCLSVSAFRNGTDRDSKKMVFVGWRVAAGLLAKAIDYRPTGNRVRGKDLKTSGQHTILL